MHRWRPPLLHVSPWLGCWMQSTAALKPTSLARVSKLEWMWSTREHSSGCPISSKRNKNSMKNPFSATLLESPSIDISKRARACSSWPYGSLGTAHSIHAIWTKRSNSGEWYDVVEASLHWFARHSKLVFEACKQSYCYNNMHVFFRCLLRYLRMLPCSQLSWHACAGAPEASSNCRYTILIIGRWRFSGMAGAFFSYEYAVFHKVQGKIETVVYDCGTARSAQAYLLNFHTNEDASLMDSRKKISVVNCLW